MKIKLYPLVLTCALFLVTTFSKAQVIVVQHGSTASVFGNLDSAMTAASAGDYLYLSGGLFMMHGIWGSGGDSVHFYKPLHFVGAGINADSTLVTGNTLIQVTNTNTNQGNILVGSGADGSTFDGIFFNSDYMAFGNGNSQADSSGHFIFTRCQFYNVTCQGLQGGTPVNLNLEFHECIMQGVSDAGENNCGATFDRCICPGQCQSLSAGVTWTNCIMGSNTDYGTVTNCLIYASNFVNQFGSIYNNCLLGGAQPAAGGSDIFNNCTFSVAVDSQFVNAPTQAFTWANNYHLINGSIAHNYGTDGHDDGIYGGTTPAKPGFVPYNPHFTSATVPTATDINGNLNINIHVAAQPY